MNRLAAISRLARIADLLAAGILPPAEDCMAHSESIHKFIRRECKSTDEAFGVACARGIGDARDAFARHKRDDWFRKAAATYEKTAKELTKIQHDYISRGSWERDRNETTCPTRLHGSVQEFIWHALKAWPREIGEKQMDAILGNETPHLTSDLSC